jgi:hypothetical protein
VCTTTWLWDSTAAFFNGTEVWMKMHTMYKYTTTSQSTSNRNEKWQLKATTLKA